MEVFPILPLYFVSNTTLLLTGYKKQKLQVFYDIYVMTCEKFKISVKTLLESWKYWIYVMTILPTFMKQVGSIGFML